MKRLARDRYLFGQENQRVTRKRNEGRRRGRGRRRGEKMGDERGDIRTGDEKIKGERGWGGGEGGGIQIRHRFGRMCPFIIQAAAFCLNR